MFDIGFGELFVCAVIALIVLGPEKLPRAARFVGLWVRKARAQWYSVKSEFEQDLAADELKRSLAETRESLRMAEEHLRGEANAIREGVERQFNEVAASVTAGVEPGATTTEPEPHADQDTPPVRRDENEGDMRSLESASHMDWEPPIPEDEVDEHAVDEDVADKNATDNRAADSRAADKHTDTPPPKHADDAHAGR
jgi:sec-independent protein translocase protein TatB